MRGHFSDSPLRFLNSIRGTFISEGGGFVLITPPLNHIIDFIHLYVRYIHETLELGFTDLVEVTQDVSTTVDLMKWVSSTCENKK